METFVVEAIRQLPALVLAVLAIYFYRSAQRANETSVVASSVPDDLIQTLESLAARADRLDSDLHSIRDEIDASAQHDDGHAEDWEGIRAQLSNQKMALKEFGRVLSKTSEQTYTEFSAFEERLRNVENVLAHRGLLDDESRPAA